MKQTSVDSYHESVEDGTIAKMEKQVLNYIKLAGPITGRAISKAIPGGWRRTKKLEDYKYIRVAYRAPCPITKKRVSWYEWISDNPKPVEKKVWAKANVNIPDALAIAALIDRVYLMGYNDAKAGMPLPEDLR